MNYGDAIQNKLVSLAAAFQFPSVHYKPMPVGQPRCTNETKVVRPSGAIAWEESAVFGDPVRHRRTSDRRELLGWIWRLQIKFNAAVSLEEFQNSLLTNIPRVPRNPAIGLDRQVDLLLEDAEYQTPVTQQPAQGTIVTYRFTAQLTPT
jgi:hypothetical protein